MYYMYSHFNIKSKLFVCVLYITGTLYRADFFQRVECNYSVSNLFSNRHTVQFYHTSK